MGKILSDEALDILFRNARTHNAWSPQPVSDTKPDSRASLPAMNVSAFNATAAASSVVSLGGAVIRALG